MSIRYYAWGHTAQGLISFAESNLSNIDEIFVLNHPSETIKTAVIKGVIKNFADNDSVEILKGINGDEFLDGVIIRDKSLAVLSRAINKDNVTVLNLSRKIDEFSEQLTNIDKIKSETYSTFDTGLKVHDELEKIYINEMNFEKADQVAESYINKLIQSSPNNEGEGYIYHRLFGTNTKNGVVNVVPELFTSVSKAYFIKGRAGTGKSTFMKKIAHAAKNEGYEVELYHCSFDSNSIDMVLVRELDFCIFDSTDPHEFFPERENDEIIDLYEELVTPGTDEKYADNIDNLNREYKSYMKKGIEFLKEAGVYQQKIEDVMKSLDEDELSSTTDQLIDLIK